MITLKLPFPRKVSSECLSHIKFIWLKATRIAAIPRIGVNTSILLFIVRTFQNHTFSLPYRTSVQNLFVSFQFLSKYPKIITIKHFSHFLDVTFHIFVRRLFSYNIFSGNKAFCHISVNTWMIMNIIGIVV